MIINYIINNIEIIHLDKFKCLLHNLSNRWIIHNSDKVINLFICERSIKNVDIIIKSIRDYLLKECVFISKSQIKFFRSKKIQNNKIFAEKLKDIIVKSDNKIINNDDIFNSIEFKGYTKKNIIELLNNVEVNNKQCVHCSKSFATFSNKNIHEKKCKKNPILLNEMNDIKCKICEKSFSSMSNKNRHEKVCIIKSTNESLQSIENDDDKKDNDKKNEIDYLMDKLSSLLKMNIDNVQNNQNIINNTNNLNIQINNIYKTPKDKLDNCLRKDMIDLDTFIENYKNDPKYHLTKDESLVLLENSEKLGIISYGEGLYTYLKKKYCLQLETLRGEKLIYTDISLPFICKDMNMRSHYQLDKNGWKLIKTTDKIKSLINISDKQIFKHHNKFIYYTSKRGKDTVIKILLKKSDYNDLESKLDSLLAKTV
jgi:hypothetical protein